MKGEEKRKPMSTPPGMSQKRERIWCYLLLLAGVIHSLRFFGEFQTELTQLYRKQEIAWIASELIWMKDFYMLVKGKYLLFWLPMLWCVINVIFRYLYYYQGSKSVYLMRRLPVPWELHYSCLARPLQRMGLCLGILVAMLFISYWYYMEKTPPQWLEPDQWQKLWRALV